MRCYGGSIQEPVGSQVIYFPQPPETSASRVPLQLHSPFPIPYVASYPGRRTIPKSLMNTDHLGDLLPLPVLPGKGKSILDGLFDLLNSHRLGNIA